MNIIRWIISRVINIYYDYQRDKERRIRQNNRRVTYPTCTLANSSKITQSQLGHHVVIHESVKLEKTTIGNHTYVSSNSSVLNAEVGHYCSIGQAVDIGLWRHPSKRFVSTYPAFFTSNNVGCHESFVTESSFNESPRNTTIGSDVWIGNNVIVPGGINIGSGAIIAAGSVVTKDVPPYAIFGGNPASLIRYRFSTAEIDFLLELKWWYWSEEHILNRAEYFGSISTLKAAMKKQ